MKTIKDIEPRAVRRAACAAFAVVTIVVMAVLFVAAMAVDITVNCWAEIKACYRENKRLCFDGIPEAIREVWKL